MLMWWMMISSFDLWRLAVGANQGQVTWLQCREWGRRSIKNVLTVQRSIGKIWPLLSLVSSGWHDDRPDAVDRTAAASSAGGGIDDAHCRRPRGLTEDCVYIIQGAHAAITNGSNGADSIARCRLLQRRHGRSYALRSRFYRSHLLQGTTPSPPPSLGWQLKLEILEKPNEARWTVRWNHAVRNEWLNR